MTAQSPPTHGLGLLAPTQLKSISNSYTAKIGELVVINCATIYNFPTLVLPADPPVGSLVGCLIYLGDPTASSVTWQAGSGNTILGSSQYTQTKRWNVTIMMFTRIPIGLPDWILYSA